MAQPLVRTAAQASAMGELSQAAGRYRRGRKAPGFRPLEKAGDGPPAWAWLFRLLFGHEAFHARLRRDGFRLFLFRLPGFLAALVLLFRHEFLLTWSPDFSRFVSPHMRIL